MNERFRSRLVMGLSLGAAAALAAGICLTGYLIWWLPNRKMMDAQWQETASPAEKKRVAELVLLFPGGNDHDAFLFLGSFGDAGSVPSLLRGLKRQGATGADGAMSCSKGHCLEALREITGHDAGPNYAAWQKWWDETGSRLPPEAFPSRKPRTGPAGAGNDRRTPR
jgi:hypothetical protein